MYCTRKVTKDLIAIGGNDRRCFIFEGIYKVPKGVSYNSYLLLDEKTVLFDTVDKAISELFMENLVHALDGRKLDYLVIHHMEPDHAACIKEVINLYPDLQIICNQKILAMLNQFFTYDFTAHCKLVKEGESLDAGKHNLKFINAPMVHWPEVMMTYDEESKILFSADAFGTFGSLDGALFVDEVDYDKDFADETRRYYANIVGKYGAQVTNLLKKVKELDIEMICPLHGLVLRGDLSKYVDKYKLWAAYEPEEKGVLIPYASIYGHTAQVADILATELRKDGIKATVCDTSMIDASEIIALAFKYSHIVFACATYNNGMFVSMENLINDLIAHNFQNRTVALVENGSWAPASGKLMTAELEKCKNIKLLECKISLKSSIKEEQRQAIKELAKTLAEDIKG